MNEGLLTAVCCYKGDQVLVERAMPVHISHGVPVVVLSPLDSPVIVPGATSHFAGKRAYIGAESLDRQLRYFEILLTYPHTHFLINDADSFCVADELPKALWEQASGTLWSNEVTEPRPHESPYPKIAAQPPYFLTRDSVWKMLNVAGRVPCHPITPYVDWFMTALCCEAGLKHRPFTDLETPSTYVFKPTNPEDPEKSAWEQLDYRIRYTGTCFCHPIKTVEQLALCRDARKFYERG